MKSPPLISSSRLGDRGDLSVTVSDAGAIRSHLRRVLESPAFRGSRRSSSFLEFVVEGALNGRWEDLKERTIAVQVFERAADVDLADDTIVRVGAREVRKRLAQYYVSHAADDDPVRIELAAGTYVPQFHVAPHAGPGSQTSAAEATAVAVRLRKRVPAWVSLTALVVAAAVLVWLVSRPGTDEIDLFWRPLIGSNTAVLVGIAHPVVYQPSNEAWRRDTALFLGHPPTLQAPFEFPESELKGSDMVRVREQFVGYGDLVAATDLTGFLTSRQRTVHSRLATRIESSDLREYPFVLIGAFTNRWTTELSHKMKYQFHWGDEMRPQIEEAETHRVWAVTPGLSDPSSLDDYLMIVRVVNSPTGKPFLILAGLKQAGTEEAAYVVTNAAEVRRLLRLVEPGWLNRNLQLVLHVRVVGGRPSEPELVAQNTW